MIWTLLPGAVFLADGCLKKKAEEELKENEQIPVCKGHIVLRKCHNRGVAGGGFADSTKFSPSFCCPDCGRVSERWRADVSVRRRSLGLRLRLAAACRTGMTGIREVT